MSPRNPSSQSHLMLTDLPPSGGRYPSLLETLAYQAQLSIRAHHDGHPDVAILLRGNGLASASDEEIHGAGLSLEQARALVAKEHGFKDWDEVLRNGSLAIDARFEAAVEAVIHGELDDLQRLLNDAPYLAHARSSYPHHSTLLHHCSANGIEHTRQWQSPRECARYRTRVAQSWCRSGRHLQRLQWRRFDHAPLSTCFIGSAGCCRRPGRSGRGALQRGREAHAPPSDLLRAVLLLTMSSSRRPREICISLGVTSQQAASSWPCRRARIGS